MVIVLLLAGSVAGTFSHCGWCREEPISLALAGDSWWLCQQAPPQHPGEAEPFISIQTRSLSDQQGAEVGPRMGAPGAMRDIRPQGLYPRCPAGRSQQAKRMDSDPPVRVLVAKLMGCSRSPSLKSLRVVMGEWRWTLSHQHCKILMENAFVYGF